ncbi:cathepsin D-like [Cimex lectularius]|uniref:Peptidase A1 domain-containing protein n=1 Tax=Cimex lectularius TaxID=79782 RepID=A0A8I6SGQ5_CIMLE|nr:cathepsin D-like [Cimex lectularius]
MAQNLLHENVFSFYINRDKDDTNGGELVLGGWNDEMFDPVDIEYIPVNDKHFWQFSVDKITVDMGNVKHRQADVGLRKFNAIADTGTSLIVGPESYIKKLLNLLGINDDLGSVDCEKIDGYPKVTFHIMNKPYTLNPRDYISHYTIKNSTVCLAGFSGQNTDESSPWIFGDTFFGKFYSIFNVDKAAVAFAPLKKNRDQ